MTMTHVIEADEGIRSSYTLVSKEKVNRMSNVQCWVMTQFAPSLRVVVIDDDRWFTAKDICDVLQLTNTSDTVKRLKIGKSKTHLMDTERGVHDMLLVDQPGMFEIIIRSDKPNAEPFMRWLLEDVLPSIWNTGTYTMPGREINAPPRNASHTRWGRQPIRDLVMKAGYTTKSFTSSANSLELSGVDGFSLGNYDSYSTGGTLPTEALVIRAEKLLSVPREQLFTADVLASYRNRGPGNHRRPGGNIPR